MTLDTSGVVHFGTAYAKAHGLKTFYRWADLSPFEQGYIEAMFASGVENKGPGGLLRDLTINANLCGFSDLAPETLAAIRKDCQSKTAGALEAPNAYEGGRFWQRRQAGEDVYFPPRALTLGDDGKVRFQ